MSIKSSQSAIKAQFTLSCPCAGCNMENTVSERQKRRIIVTLYRMVIIVENDFIFAQWLAHIELFFCSSEFLYKVVCHFAIKIIFIWIVIVCFALTPRISGFCFWCIGIERATTTTTTTHTNSEQRTHSHTTAEREQHPTHAYTNVCAPNSAHHNIVIISHNLSGHNNGDICNKMCKLSVCVCVCRVNGCRTQKSNVDL